MGIEEGTGKGFSWQPGYAVRQDRRRTRHNARANSSHIDAKSHEATGNNSQYEPGQILPVVD